MDASQGALEVLVEGILIIVVLVLLVVFLAKRI
jgi:hypothetical protein